MLIQPPIVRVDSAERPVSCTSSAIRDLLVALEKHKQTAKYKAVKLTSAERMDKQDRLSKQIWWGKANLERGRTLAEHRDVGTVLWDDLDDIEQDLVMKYDSGKAERILTELQAQRSPIYRGTSVEAFTWIVSAEQPDPHWVISDNAAFVHSVSFVLPILLPAEQGDDQS